MFKSLGLQSGTHNTARTVQYENIQDFIQHFSVYVNSTRGR